MQKTAYLFIIPACFCIVVSYFDVMLETSFFTKPAEVEIWENRLNDVKQDIPPGQTVCYQSNTKSASAYFRTAYVLSPLYIQPSTKPKPSYLIYDCIDDNLVCRRHFRSQGFRLEQEYANGIRLFVRRNR